MHSLAQYALLGSLVAGAAGALILAVITLRYGIMRRREADDEGVSTEEVAQRLRTVRLADTLAVLCFAVAAGLGVLGLTQTVHTTPTAIAAIDDTLLRERVNALEGRLASAEHQLQARPEAPDMRPWEERLARLETRLGAVEDRAAVAERRASEADRRATDADRRVTDVEQVARRELRTRTAPVATPKKPALPVVSNPATVPTRPPGASPALPGASPRLTPPGRDGLSVPEAARQGSPEPPKHEVGVAHPAETAPAAVEETSRQGVAVPAPPSSSRAPVESTLREAARGRSEPGAREPLRARVDAVSREPARVEPARRAPSLGEKLRRDWNIIREHAERGGDEWRDGWRQLKGLFGNNLPPATP